MKKVLNKNLILGILIGLSFSIVSVYAATTYLASDIKYKNTSVESSLNDLYKKNITTRQPDLTEIFTDNYTFTNDYSFCMLAVARYANGNSLKLNDNEITPNTYQYYSGGKTSLMTHIFTDIKSGDKISVISLGTLHCWE